MPETPQNAEYLILGLAVVFGFMGIFIASMIVRFRNFQKDIETIRLLHEDE